MWIYKKHVKDSNQENDSGNVRNLKTHIYITLGSSTEKSSLGGFVSNASRVVFSGLDSQHKQTSGDGNYWVANFGRCKLLSCYYFLSDVNGLLFVSSMTCGPRPVLTNLVVATLGMNAYAAKLLYLNKYHTIDVKLPQSTIKIECTVSVHKLGECVRM